VAVTVSSVRTFGGAAFSAVADADVQRWIDYALRILDSDVWGDAFDDVTTFLSLHYIQQFVLSGGSGGAVGAISSVSVGSVSVSYSGSGSGSSVDENDLGTTAWGRLYLNLRNSLGSTPIYA